MGCDYHYIHHRYNWYNFGFMTVTMDTLFNTVKHPKNKSWNPGDALRLAHGVLPMPASELKRSAALTDAILTSRGAGDALTIMRGEDAGDQQEAKQEAHQAATQLASPEPAADSAGDAAAAAALPAAANPADAEPTQDSKGREFMCGSALRDAPAPGHHARCVLSTRRW